MDRECFKSGFRFHSKYNKVDDKWEYKYEYDGDEITFNKLVCSDDEIIIDVTIQNNEAIVEFDVESEKDEETIRLVNNKWTEFEEKNLRDILKRIPVININSSSADDKGNICVYKHNEGDPFIRAFIKDDTEPFIYSDKELAELTELYKDLPEEKTKIYYNGSDNIFFKQYIKQVDLIKNHAYKYFDVYFMYVIFNTMFEGLTHSVILRFNNIDSGQQLVASNCTIDRINNLLNNLKNGAVKENEQQKEKQMG